jgi:hypothetical protein
LIGPSGNGGASFFDCLTGQTATFSSADVAAQAAIDRLHAGGTVTFRAGTYALTGGIQLRDGITLSGEVGADGMPSTVLQVSSSQTGGNTIRNFVNNGVSPAPLTGSKAIRVANLKIDAGNFVEYLVTLARCVNCTISNVHVDRTIGSGFGSNGCTNLLIENSSARTGVPYSATGHGFSLAGDPEGVQDVGTILLNSSASGFNEGVLTRTVTQASRANKDFKIIGGNYFENIVGIRLRDVTNPVIQGVRVYNNAGSGLEANYPGLLPHEAVRVTVLGGSFEYNGHLASDSKGGISLAGAESVIQGAILFENRPDNVSLYGKYIYLIASRFEGNGSSHVRLNAYGGAPLTGWSIRSCFRGSAVPYGAGTPVLPGYSFNQWFLDWASNSADPPVACQ